MTAGWKKFYNLAGEGNDHEIFKIESRGLDQGGFWLSRQRFKKYIGFWTLLSFLGLFLFFVFLHLNSFNAPFERDEGHYAYGSWLLRRGLTPYINTFEQKPPMIFYPYLLAVLINPDAFWPPRLIAALSLMLTLLLLGLIVSREHGGRAGLMVMWLALPMIMFPYLKPFAANTEKFMILPLVGTLAIRRSWFWAGVCAVIAVLYKQIALFPVFFIFGVWLIEDRNRSLRKCFSALGGGAAAFFLFTGYFLARGALSGFWEQLVEFNKYYAFSFGVLNFGYLFRHFQAFLSAWPAVFILLVWFLIKHPPRFWFYLGLMIVSLLPIFNSPHSHYYIMLMPFWAIVTAVSLDSLIEEIVQKLKKPRWAAGLAFAFVFLVVFSMVWPVREYYTMSPLDLVVRSYGPLNPFVESPIVARQVAKLTAPDDYVFIAGTEQQILYYAKRLAPTRFSGMYGLMMDHPKALAYQKELIQDLEKHPPKVIVMVRSPFSWLRQERSPTLIFEHLDTLMKDRYDLVGGCIRRKDIAYWEEPLTKKDKLSCSLLVFRRK